MTGWLDLETITELRTRRGWALIYWLCFAAVASGIYVAVGLSFVPGINFLSRVLFVFVGASSVALGLAVFMGARKA